MFCSFVKINCFKMRIGELFELFCLISLYFCLFVSSFVQGQDVYSISVLPEEGNTSPKCTPQLTFLSLLEVPFSSKNQMCLDAQLSCQNCIDLKVDTEDDYSSCILDINIEKENSDILKSSNETVGNTKSEGVVTVSTIHLPVYHVAIRKIVSF